MSEGVPIYKQNDRQREITRWRSFCAFKSGPVLLDCREVPESASNQLNVSCRDPANLAILGLNLEPMSVCTQAKHRHVDVTQQSKYGSGTNARSLANTEVEICAQRRAIRSSLLRPERRVQGWKSL